MRDLYVSWTSCHGTPARTRPIVGGSLSSYSRSSSTGLLPVAPVIPRTWPRAHKSHSNGPAPSRCPAAADPGERIAE